MRIDTDAQIAALRLLFKRMRTLALALIAGLSCPAYSGAADDLCTVAPGNCKVLKEDEKVRVLEFTARKGDKTPMHYHPAYVVYIVKAGVSRFTLPDGTSVVRRPKDGEVFINPPVTHSEECLEDQIAILVELKQQPL